MVSSSTYTLLSFVGWTVLPDFVTRHVLRLSSQLPFLSPLPPPNTPAYITRYRYTFSLVVIAFLLYNLLEGSRSTQPNFYELLGVNPQAEEQTLKLAFRQFAKVYHPDKMANEGPGTNGGEVFMAVRDAFEALKNPIVRFAYDRFGPDVLSWKHCTTTREYLRQGLMRIFGYHIVTGAALLFWSSIGDPSPIAFWRYIIFAFFFVSELLLVLNPSLSMAYAMPSTYLIAAPCHTTVLHMFFPYRVVYQHVLFLRQVFMALSIALSRVAPKLFPDEPKVGKAVVEKIRGLAAFADRESSIMLHTELHSIDHTPTSIERVSFAAMKPHPHPSKESTQLLAQEIENMIVEGHITKEAGPLKSACDKAISSSKTDQRFRVDLDDTTLLSPGSSTRPEAVVRLPSPRRPSPSPPHELSRRRSSFIRSRSGSY